jgi:glucan endo-1,3-alpha-glucosidase
MPRSDGFVLNVGKEDWQQDRVAMCFEAAASSSAPFTLFISFDTRFVLLHRFFFLP